MLLLNIDAIVIKEERFMAFVRVRNETFVSIDVEVNY